MTDPTPNDAPVAIKLEALDLAALLCSRVCHDVISPVGAIVNGLEVLEDEKDEAMRGFAQDLIKKSAKQASARLQFARLAFGAAGSAGAAIDTGDAENVARGFIGDERTQLSWDMPRVLLPKNQVKLLLNLLVIASATIPRGGTIHVHGTVVDDKGSFTLTTQGPSARIPAHVERLIAGESEGGTIDAHGIQPYFTGLVARSAAMDVSLALEGEGAVVKATPRV
jgi:histidine phosphotransferase ChpT